MPEQKRNADYAPRLRKTKRKCRFLVAWLLGMTINEMCPPNGETSKRFSPWQSAFRQHAIELFELPFGMRVKYARGKARQRRVRL